VRYILAGTNLASESILPRSWSQGHSDWRYIRAINRQFGSGSLKTFPHRSIFQEGYYRFIKGIKWISVLNYIAYDKEEAKKEIMEAIGWKDYGAKHYESNYTKIFQAYILPTKFGFDKRKAHLSSLICAGQMTRERALEIIQEPLYNPDALEKDIYYLVNKFGITRGEFDAIMKLPPKKYMDYPNYGKPPYPALIKAAGLLLKR
jgi:hypothetical protein